MEYLRKELANERLITDVAKYPRGAYSLIKAATGSLSDTPGKTELLVLTKAKKLHEIACTHWSNFLIFSREARMCGISEQVALIKLIRRGLVNIYEVYSHQNGYQYVWEVKELPQ